MPISRSGIVAAALFVVGAAVTTPSTVSAQGVTPEVEACQTSGLIALKEHTPGLKNVILDAATLTQSKADTKVGDAEVRTVILADAHLETGKTDKARKFVCLIGEKGKVLLTFFATEK